MSSEPLTTREKARFWAEMVAAFAAAVVLVGPVMDFVGDRIDELRGSDGAPRIEVSQAHVVNGLPVSSLVGGEFVLTAATAPSIDITVLNRGEEPVLLDEARVTIEDSARLPPCIYGGGGDVPRSRPYTIFLPILPTPEERVRHRRLHEEVPAKRADRFVLQFGTPPDLETDHLYAVRVELLTDEPREAVKAGRFLLGVPGPPSQGGVILPQSDATLESAANPYQHSTHLASVWCFRRNLAALDRLLERPGERSPQIRSLAGLQLAASWPRFAGTRSARASVEPLLHVDLNDAPGLAVFAAEQTGEETLIERTRERAIELLLERVERDMGEFESPSAAVMDARMALAIGPSPEARAALRRAEVALTVEEEERAELEAREG